MVNFILEAVYFLMAANVNALAMWRYSVFLLPGAAAD
jgi:hypothetical protein